MRAAVERTSGVQLELEVRVIGEPRDAAAGGRALMFGRKANRRRVESRARALRSCRRSAPCGCAGCAPCSSLPLAAVAFYGVFKGVQLVLDQPVRNLVVEGTFQRVTPIQVEAAVAEGLDAGFLTVESRQRCASACRSSTGSIAPTSAGAGPTR